MFSVLQDITKVKEHKWILDSGCSIHMSGKSSLFSDLKKQSFGTITLGDKGKCDIIGIGKICYNSFNFIDDVYLVDPERLMFAVLQDITKVNEYKWILDSGCSRNMSVKSSLL